MKTRYAIALAVIGGGICVALYAHAQQQQPTAGPHVYFTTPLENDSSRIVRLQSVTIAPDKGIGFHRHPGDQWAAVQEGEMTFTIKGQAPRVLKAGDSVYIPRGTIHRVQNLGDKPVRSIELVILDKDKPALDLVAD